MDQPSESPVSPLGGPITQDSAEQRAKNPLNWHQRYWINLHVLGILNYHNEDVLAAMITMAQTETMAHGLYVEFKDKWDEYQSKYQAQNFRYWKSMDPECDGYVGWVMDLEKMLEDKQDKIRDYLDHKTTLIASLRQRGDTVGADVLSIHISRICHGLRQEHLRTYD